jgi:hypothetical protein
MIQLKKNAAREWRKVVERVNDENASSAYYRRKYNNVLLVYFLNFCV